LIDDGPLPSFGLTPTYAVVVAAALLRDQNLTPFDLTVWFQRAASEAKKSNSFTVAAARAQEQFAKRLALLNPLEINGRPWAMLPCSSPIRPILGSCAVDSHIEHNISVSTSRRIAEKSGPGTLDVLRVS
jgi:hypothetical protein